MNFIITHYSYVLLILGLVGITILFIYFRKERPMYVAAPIVFVGGLALIAIAVSQKYGNSDSRDIWNVVNYLKLNVNKPNRLYISGYLMLWYAFVAMILYPFYKKKLTDK